MTEYAVIDGQRVALTEWFPPGTKPVHVGVYEIRNRYMRRGGLFRHWDGDQWFFSGMSPSRATTYFQKGFTGSYENVPGEEWRGLSHPPGAT